MPARKLGKVHHQTVEILKAHPKGISMNDITRLLGIPAGEQVHYNRRFRELYPHYEIKKVKEGGDFLYVLVGPKEVPLDDSPISNTLRSAVLHAARGRCSMCGRTIEHHGIDLVVDHKLPRAWGGTTELENLWALCTDCNLGKRDFFSSVDSPELRSAIWHKSVHVRIGELLKAHKGEPVDATLIELVAGQSDWPKRTRDLRYLGWEIAVEKRKLESGRVISAYRLISHTEWPADPSKVIRDYERDREARNLKARSSDQEE